MGSYGAGWPLCTEPVSDPNVCHAKTSAQGEGRGDRAAGTRLWGPGRGDWAAGTGPRGPGRGDQAAGTGPDGVATCRGPEDGRGPRALPAAGRAFLTVSEPPPARPAP